MARHNPKAGNAAIGLLELVPRFDGILSKPRT
jgi:hypothetical protein